MYDETVARYPLRFVFVLGIVFARRGQYGGIPSGFLGKRRPQQSICPGAQDRKAVADRLPVSSLKDLPKPVRTLNTLQ